MPVCGIVCVVVIVIVIVINLIRFKWKCLRRIDSVGYIPVDNMYPRQQSTVDNLY